MSGLAQISVSLRSRALQHHAAIVFRGLGLVVEQAGADDVVGLFQRRGHRIEAAIDRVVALGAEPEHLLGRDARRHSAASGRPSETIAS